jgi:thiamine-phosphate diphosphorylase
VLPRLHAVTNDQILRLADLEMRARNIARAGDVALHLRARLMPARQLVEIAQHFRSAGGTLFVNDRLDVAAHVTSHGVHLPSAGLPIATVRRLLGPSFTIGRSTHSPEEAVVAWEEGADYVFLGPIWKTASHPGQPGIGPHAIERAQPARVIAIGGITPSRVPMCTEMGAYGVAAVSALWGAVDPAAAATQMLVCFGKS